MTDETMIQKILGNFKSIKRLITFYEGLNKKVRRMSSEIEALRRENARQEKAIKTLEGMISHGTDE